MKNTNTLLYDYCRCAGNNCDRKAECLRHIAWKNMEPGKPWMERYCECGRESEGFILNKKDETNEHNS